MNLFQIQLAWDRFSDLINVDVCIYVLMYVCMYVCIYICMYVCMYTWIYVCMCVCTYVCMCVRVYVCMYFVCVCVCMYVYIYVCFFNLLSTLHYFTVILHAVNLHISFICRDCNDQHHGVSHCGPFTILNNTPIKWNMYN